METDRLTRRAANLRRRTARACRLGVALCLLGCGEGEAPVTDSDAPLAGSSLVLLTLDTARADYFSVYGGPEGLTPNVDRLAAGGTVFENAYSQSNVTNPSHTAILTGLYGIDARILNNFTTFSFAESGSDTLASAFGKLGYRTAAFLAAPHLSLLALPGFDHAPQASNRARAGPIVNAACDWIREQRGEPFFAWVHLFDPHSPYHAPTAYRSQFYQGDPTRGPGPRFADRETFGRAADVVRQQFAEVRDPDYPLAMYRAEMRYVDDQVGELLGCLQQAGVAEKTGVILVADHGESLGEHDIFFGHGGLYEVSLRIPFVVRLPGLPDGNRVEGWATHVDIVPTLEALYGIRLESSSPRHGRALTEELQGQPGSGEPRVLIHEHANNLSVAARKGPWKLVIGIVDRWWYDTPVRLFNLEQDPDELRNVAEENPAIVAELEPLLRRWVEAGHWKLRNSTLEPDALERLRALGYLDDARGESP
ncbi:MAG: sulfatase [Myxococcota bacterium]